MMVAAIALVLLSLMVSPALLGELDDHRDFQYNSLVDNRGLYNFAYDTGSDPDNAHSMHMEYKDQYGVVRGRYGYTDPHGKLRVVEYEAGPGGFKARGDVGPDLHPHQNAPENPSQPPIRMAGWDPIEVPIDEKVEAQVLYAPQVVQYKEVYPVLGNEKSTSVKSLKETEAYQVKGQVVSHVAIPPSDSVVVLPVVDKSQPLQKSQPLTIHNIDVDPNDIRMTSGQHKRDLSTTSAKLVISEQLPAEHRDVSTSIKTKGSPIRIVEHASETKGKVVVSHNPKTIYTHDDTHHHHDAATKKYISRATHDHDAEVERYVARPTHEHYTKGTGYVARQTHDHDAEVKRYVARPTHEHYTNVKGYVARQTHDHDAEVKRYVARPTHDHYIEGKGYVARQTHDHDAEVKKYVARPTHEHYTNVKGYVARQTHDHDAEIRKYPSRQTHDHAAEVKKYPLRQTHDHAAEFVKYPSRQTHNHYAEIKAVKNARVHDHRHDHGSEPLKVYYNDDHDTKPHEHLPGGIYDNDHDHGHSDRHLYADRRPHSVYPLKPRLLRSRPGTPYSPASYYWS